MPPYWKFESTSLQRRVRDEPLPPSALERRFEKAGPMVGGQRRRLRDADGEGGWRQRLRNCAHPGHRTGRALGAEPVVESDGVGAQLASRPLDAVIDTIGGDALESTCEALRPNGIIVSVVRAPDEAYVRSRSMRAAYFIVDVTRDRLDRISAIVQRGTLNLPVGEVLDLADAKIAHRMLDGAPHKPGKIVLKVAD